MASAPAGEVLIQDRDRSQYAREMFDEQPLAALPKEAFTLRRRSPEPLVEGAWN
jgi:hypothetical protein